MGNDKFRELLDRMTINSLKLNQMTSNTLKLEKSFKDAQQAFRQLPPRPRMKLPDYFMTEPEGRAGTEAEKGDILARLWDAWQDCAPRMRLGQFIYNAISADINPTVEDKRGRMDTVLFYGEDYNLIQIIEKYADTMKGETP